MTDSERLDAIGQYGLCVATHDLLNHGEWKRTWVCTYHIGTEQRIMMAPTIRDVIDAAILDLTTSSVTEH